MKFLISLALIAALAIAAFADVQDVPCDASLCTDDSTMIWQINGEDVCCDETKYTGQAIDDAADEETCTCTP